MHNHSFILVFLLLGPSSDWEQCEPDAGDCCEANNSQGCEDPACCEAVCFSNPLCCSLNWGPGCANLASNVCISLCGDCGSGNFITNPCCAANDTPYCYDESCCQSVCAVDPFCCDAEGGVWDQRCADLAGSLCQDLSGCSPPPPPTCPGAGNCCEANNTPLCNNSECCNSVCAIDPYCCEVEWTQCCADLAAATCPHPTWDTSLCGPPPPSICGPDAGDCCDSHGGLGCDVEQCCQTVCADDPFCCEIAWDGTCAIAAIGSCGSLCADPFFTSCKGVCGHTPFKGCSCTASCIIGESCCPDICRMCDHHPDCNPADLTGDNTVGVDDLLILLAAWGDCPNIAEHCPDPAECPADFNDDLIVGVDDLLFLLENWSD